MTVDKRKIEQACLMLLDAIGEDPGREGLNGTPARVASMWAEFAAYKDDNIGKLGDYFLVDLNVGMALIGGGRIDFAIKNIFDKEFESYEEGKALDSYGRFLSLTYRRGL